MRNIEITQELLEDVIKLIDDLGFDYARLSKTGKQTYLELSNKLKRLRNRLV
jgi:hypothetical protein